MHLDDACQEYASKLTGNWTKLDNFAWYDKPVDAGQFARVFMRHRDSDLLAESNLAVFERELAEFSEDAWFEHVNCWAYGWRVELVIRPMRDGQYTQAFRKFVELQCALSDYPVLDDFDYSQREYDAAIKALEYQARDIAGKYELELPDSIAGDLFTWLWEHDQPALENRDGNGAWPSVESVETALVALGYLVECDE